MLKLREALKTRYLQDWFERDARQLMENHDIIDISGCKFGPAIANTILELQRSTNKVFINSSSEQEDSILKNNKDFIYELNRLYNVERRELSCDSSNVFEVAMQIGKSNIEVVYYLNTVTTKWCKYLAILVLLLYPNVIIDLGSSNEEIFSLIRNITEGISIDRYDSFLEAKGDAVVIRYVNDEDKVVLDCGKVMDKNKYYELYNCLPGIVGSVRLLNEDKDFDCVMKYVMSEVSKELYSPKKKQLGILDYIQFRR